METRPFNPENIDEVVKITTTVWDFDDSPEFTRVFSNYLVRYNYYSPKYSFQAEDEDGLQAVAFTWMPGEENDAEKWFQEQLVGVNVEVRGYLLRSASYMKRTDEELLTKMEPNSAKLSFFISRKPGCGTLLLHHLTEKLRQQGIKWLYLWTDTWCNWQYYPRHGFERIGQGHLSEFSSEGDEYYYFLYRKRIV